MEKTNSNPRLISIRIINKNHANNSSLKAFASMATDANICIEKSNFIQNIKTFWSKIKRKALHLYNHS